MSASIREVTYVCVSCGVKLVYDGKLPEYRHNHRREGEKCDGALIEASPAPSKA